MAEALSEQSSARERALRLLGALSIEEKIGQLVQVNGCGGSVHDWLGEAVRQGRIGSVINEVEPQAVIELQRIARRESPHGIPLLIGRDVIHGFKTVLPIPLGLAATWNTALVRQGARVSAVEAAHQGVNWTFSPMLDVSRDPRWGRIAESFGEDPLLTAEMGSAMVDGYQNGGSERLISCLKHFVGYGASEAGRDYNTTNIPELELRNVYLPPFLAALRAGALTVMPSFSDLNGMPPTGNVWLLRTVLRDEWQFGGLVVSDWESITQLSVHGVTEDAEQAALQAVRAGVNIDMASGAYADHLAGLVEAGALDPAMLDELVTDVLTVKYQAGLFDEPLRDYVPAPRLAEAELTAKRLAIESAVLLKNEAALLPLSETGAGTICLLGPLADQPYEQLGTWIFDGDVDRSISVRQAFEARLGDRLRYAPVLSTSRDRSHDNFDDAIRLAEGSDAVVLVLGEEAILSGEAHCRADITLPGAQAALVEAVHGAGRPVALIVLAGRPLALESIVDRVDALIYAWHPGSMAGPALAELVFGDENPCGKLPVTMPRSVGQVPIYYAHGNTGKPPTPETVVAIDDIDPRAPQLSVGNTSFHLDVSPTPLYPFGFGLSYTSFAYANLRIENEMRSAQHPLVVAVDVTNVGERAGVEIAQLYVRDLVASVTRPVRELKAFERIELGPGETGTVEFRIEAQDLSFHNGREQVVEPGVIRLWVGGSSDASLSTDVSILSDR